jgi:hypothetical protein
VLSCSSSRCCCTAQSSRRLDVGQLWAVGSPPWLRRRALKHRDAQAHTDSIAL